MSRTVGARFGSRALGVVAVLAAIAVLMLVSSPPAHAAGEASLAGHRTLDSLFARVARDVPAFGGMFLEGRKLVVYLTNTARREAAEKAIRAVFGRTRVPPGGIEVLQGSYGFLKLRAWHTKHRLGTLSIPGVVLVDIDEARNRLRIGISDPGITAQVRASLDDAGVPRKAVAIVEVDPVTPEKTVQDTRRPLIGGIQIAPDGGGTCTLGVLAVLEGEAGFVTNSHCTNVTGGPEGTVFHQASDSGDGTSQVGIEMVDPPFGFAGACPPGRLCRFSDSAFVRRDSGPGQAAAPADAEFGYIANATGGSLDIVGKHRITAESGFPPLDGQVLQKVGRTTGGTKGTVSATCVDVNQQGTNLTLLCQYQAGYGSGPGDSGSPVFDSSCVLCPPNGIPTATLYGLHWGASGTFSFIGDVGSDLVGGGIPLDFKTFKDDLGKSSGPEVKIMSPLDGTTVGIGGLNIVTFDAEVADYEGCCSSITWTSTLDGVIATGTTDFDLTFATQGTRTITVTVVDDDGKQASDSIELSASGDAPTVSIISPTWQETLYTGVVYVLEGDSYDPNEPFLKLPCASLVWTSSKPSDPFPKTGCYPSVVFTTVGARTLTLTGTDSSGQTGTDTVWISVETPASGSPPIATIESPTPNKVLDPYVSVTLRGRGNDPDDESPVAYQWAVIDGITTTVIGTGSAFDNAQFAKSWKPADTVPFSCGGRTVTIRLVVTDVDGLKGQATVNVYIAYPPC
jgi:hypothetical protein